MDKRLLKTLKKLYKYSNSYYDSERSISLYNTVHRTVYNGKLKQGRLQ